MNKNWIWFALWLIIWSVVVGVGCMMSTPKSQGQTETINELLVSHNALLPVSPIEFPKIQVLASKIMDCESGDRHEGIWGKAGEYGIAQFKKNTFYWMSGLAGLKNPDWKNREQQIWLLEWALKNGYEEHWTCYKLVNNN